MRTTIWAVIAVVLAIANFVVDLGTQTPGGEASVKASASVGYALGPAIIAALFMIPKRFRGWGNFFKYTAIIAFLALLAGLGNIKPPPKP